MKIAVGHVCFLIGNAGHLFLFCLAVPTFAYITRRTKFPSVSPLFFLPSSLFYHLPSFSPLLPTVKHCQHCCFQSLSGFRSDWFSYHSALRSRLFIRYNNRNIKKLGGPAVRILDGFKKMVLTQQERSFASSDDSFPTGQLFLLGMFTFLASCCNLSRH